MEGSVRCSSCQLLQFLPSRGRCLRCGALLFYAAEIPLNSAVCVRDACLALGSAIRTVRSRQHLSQKDLSTLAGVERSHLSRIETGFEPSPRFCTVVRLLRALGVTLVLRVEMNRSPQQEQRRRS